MERNDRRRGPRAAIAAPLLVLLVAAAGCGAAGGPPVATGLVVGGVGIDAYLGDYGRWIELQPYGLVWEPDVGPGWAPFSQGHWIWTANGWTWVSYEPFGWVVDHYGDWGYRPALGWFWVPGDVWSPARVEWRTFGDHVAWAPIPPAGIRWDEPWRGLGREAWHVVPLGRLADEHVGRYRLREPFPGFHAGIRFEQRPPERQRVERLGGRRLPEIALRRAPTRYTMPAAPHRGERRGGQEARGQRRGPPRERLHRMVLPPRQERHVQAQRQRVERHRYAHRRQMPAQGRGAGRRHHR